MSDAEMVVVALPGDVTGVSCPFPGRSVILLDESLDQVERNAVLAHELIHLERGGVCPEVEWWEERQVEDEVARRLVPAWELHQMLVDHETMGERVHPWMVAEHFRVPEPVAERAMRLLLDRIRGDIATSAGWSYADVEQPTD